MVARIDPAKVLGLSEGDALVIRNAGSRASDDALRTLATSHQPFGTREIGVVHYTHCQIHTFSNDQLRYRLRHCLGADASGIDFLPIGDLNRGVHDDVATIRTSSLVPDDVVVSGFVYDVRTARLQRVD